MVQVTDSTTQEQEQEGPEPLPDRVCIFKTSQYFHPKYLKIGVVFNDRVTFDVVEYCVSEGWILKQMRDGRNRIIYERGVHRTIKLQGTVEPYWR